MEELKRARRPTRWLVAKLSHELEELLRAETIDKGQVMIKFRLYSVAYGNLQAQDNAVLTQMAIDNVCETDEQREIETMLGFSQQYEELSAQKEQLYPETPTLPVQSLSGREAVDFSKQRNFKLPEIKMTKFSGNLEDWLAWWAQFQKIDEDPCMLGSDKFWYLLQSLEPGSDAYAIARSYPQSNENYSNVIEALKERFGNEDLLLQVYIRKLLNLIITNVRAKEKIPLEALHIQLDSHLRALNTLKLEKADRATWLFPLVESSLPEKVLDNWQRSSLSETNVSKEKPDSSRLDLLMSFLKKEAGIKQRVDMARTFAKNQERLSTQQERSDYRPTRGTLRNLDQRPSVHTLSNFHNVDKVICVFCERNNHSSKNCLRAKEMNNDERMNVLKNKQLCFRCCGNHSAKNCKTPNIRCELCHRAHFTILCKDYKGRSKHAMTSRRDPPAKRVRVENDNGEGLQVQTSNSRACIGTSNNVTFQTLMVIVENDGRKQELRAFIDTGCDRSYISKRAAHQLRLKPAGAMTAIHNLWGGSRTGPIIHHKYNIVMKSKESDFQLVLSVREQDPLGIHIPNSLQQYPKVLEELNAKNIKLTDYGGSEADILIGGDAYPYLMTGEFIKLSTGAAAIKTKMGWTVLGELRRNHSCEDSIATSCISMSVNDSNITTLWDLETLGIKDPVEQKEIHKKVELAKEKYISSISRDLNGRYIAKLPWKEETPSLPSNKQVALKRLHTATKRLEDSGMFEAYDSIFKDWEKSGFIERVTICNPNKKLHYLPHRAVIKKDSLTTPVRPVFDASCRVGKAPSLNDCLFTGENYVLKILDILLRFREKSVAFIADIKKAFQMIGLHENDRDAVRFLWWKDIEKTETIEYRHARVVFGVTCSPFILACVINYHLERLPYQDLDFGKKLLSTLYVDNCVMSEDTAEEYFQFKEQAVEKMKDAAMELRLWQSNIEDTEDVATQVVSVLGLEWNRKDDTLSVNLKSFTTPDKITKRTLLSAVQKIYDPIGFTCPAVLPMKILLQRIWQSKIKWDQELGEAEQRSFIRWSAEAKHLGELKIPRLSTNGSYGRQGWTIHVFGDASKTAYSATVFLRVAGHTTTVQLLCAKSRVAPVKEVTIPKLELMACVLCVRLYNNVKFALNLNEVAVYFYSDSTTALAWIQNNDQFGTFVSNRVKEILLTTNPQQWRHVAGVNNPADLPSRGCYPNDCIRSHWWTGPKWLYMEESNWPKQHTSDMINLESKMGNEAEATENVISFAVSDAIRGRHTFHKMVRIVGWIRRFLHNKIVKKGCRRSGELTQEEIRVAEIMFIREIQREEYTKDNCQKLKGLETCNDEWGLIRVKTRLTYRKDLGDYRYPILLPHNRPEVKQLIQDYHERVSYHAGVSYLMSILRNKYWITKARHTIRSVVFKCIRCKRFRVKAIIPAPSPLPLDRIKDVNVFEVVGVDLAGPLILRNGSKAWLVIFTCGVYRAVHFEAVASLSTRAFIRVLETFVEKYRRPATIYSDNGTNFRGSENLFRQLNWKEIMINEYVSKIEWKFNPVTSSWWGGWWERLIRIAKDLLRRTVGKRNLNFNELKIILKGIGEVMNARPLTHISDDVNDLEPLTPAIFLHPLGNAKFPERELTEGDKLRCRFNYMNKLKQELRGRFLREYLSMLVNRTSSKATKELKVGELVLVGSDNTKRNFWPLGRIVETFAGRDQVTRLAKVKTEQGEIVRSVQRLYPLEVDVNGNVNESLRVKRPVNQTKNENGEARITKSGRLSRPPVRF